MDPFLAIRIWAVASAISGGIMLGTFTWQDVANVDTTAEAADGQEQQDPEEQDPEPDDPDPDDPDPDDPDPDDPEIQNFEIQNLEIQNGDPDDPEDQDPEIQGQEIQQDEVQNAEIQQDEIQNAEIDDPDPGGLTCPGGFTAGELTINTPGGQKTLFVCIMNP